MSNKGNELVLYHGRPDKQIVPTYGLGNDKHDYGKGFYLTGSPVLASEWSVCNPIEKNGWVHKFVLDTSQLVKNGGDEYFSFLAFMLKLSYRF